jgi:exodeoxyribonuclease-1
MPCGFHSRMRYASCRPLRSLHHVPIGEDGHLLFKLDRVAPLNGFAHERAHDAVADVDATIFLCRILMEQAPELWSAFM